MSTITSKRRAVQRSTNWPAYRAQRAVLADMFAVIAYSGQPKRPLALGILGDMVCANTGLTHAEIRHFLRAYTYGPRYLGALTHGANRLGLDGLPRGYVTADEAGYAARCLAAHYWDRERRRVVAGMRREVEAVVEQMYAEAA